MTTALKKYILYITQQLASFNSLQDIFENAECLFYLKNHPSKQALFRWHSEVIGWGMERSVSIPIHI